MWAEITVFAAFYILLNLGLTIEERAKRRKRKS